MIAACLGREVSLAYRVRAAVSRDEIVVSRRRPDEMAILDPRRIVRSPSAPIEQAKCHVRQTPTVHLV
jgi:hypothetical protein